MFLMYFYKSEKNMFLMFFICKFMFLTSMLLGLGLGLALELGLGSDALVPFIRRSDAVFRRIVSYFHE